MRFKLKQQSGTAEEPPFEVYVGQDGDDVDLSINGILIGYLNAASGSFKIYQGNLEAFGIPIELI